MSEILFENEACLVINKYPGEDGQNPSLPKAARYSAVHRLDTPASGCLLLAKTKTAAAFLGEAFVKSALPLPDNPGTKVVEKRYWAIIEKPEADAVLAETWKEAVHWIGFSRQRNKSFALAGEAPKTKKAVMRFRLAGSGENYSFLEIDLVTGRHHQIRCQLAAIGFHIKGDLKYGARRSERSGGIRLHARSLVFPNPLEPGERVSVFAAPPSRENLRNPYGFQNPQESQDPLWDAFLKSALL